MWHTCAHVMAFQKIFDPMLAPEAREATSPITSTEEMAGSMS
jgi:hypothetical protein